ALRAREQLRGEVAERAYDLRLDQLDLPVQEGLARVDLIRLWIAVARRPRLEHVRDEHLLAREPDLLQELVKELAGAAHERQALLVLVHPGRLAHEHEIGVRVAGPEHDPGARLREWAA